MNETLGTNGQSAGLFRRTSYLRIFPFAIAAVLLGWYFGAAFNDASVVHRLLLPAMAVWLTALFLAFWWLPARLKALEYTLFFSFAVFFLIRLGHALYGSDTEQSTTAELAEFAFWFPALYVFTLLAFGVERGKWLVIGYFATAVVLTAPFMVGLGRHGVDAQAAFSLIQFTMASAVTIFLLVALGRLVKKLALSASQLSQLAHTDPLTELNNRRRLEQYLDESIARSLRYGNTFSLIMIDIDHFKQVNDRYGHDAGDIVLQELARLLKAICRETDFVARLGGEEFVVVLPEIALQEAEHTANRLRHAIAAAAFGRVGTITASLGVVEHQPGDTQGSLLNRADCRLYQAKAAGRNRIASQTPALPQVHA